MDAHLRAGAAIYNAGEYHAAHDAWEEEWLDRERGTDDERLLHGLIQFTAAIHHAHHANWAGVRGLAESGADYLADLPADHRGVNVGAVGAYLEATRDDPEHVERVGPPRLTVDDAALALADLDFEETAVAAPVLAEEYPGYDETVVERAVAYAHEDLAAGDDGSKFITLVMDFVADAENRGLVYQRLRGHVERRRARERDVEGLFD